jgi:fermentation-respiration switch protein FrsA (DUF1100 family)
MNDENDQKGLWSLALPLLAIVGGVSALEYARSRFQRSRVFVPDRYPDGIWDPEAFGLPAADSWFKSEDGVDLHGWWVPHPAARGTLLYCHGNTGSIAHRIGVFLLLRRLRVNLFAFDYRGYGRSAGEPTESGLYLDIRAAYEHLTAALQQPSSELILFGHSLGGAVAIDCALSRPVAGLVVQSSFTHIRDAARAMFPTLPVHLAARRQFCSVEKVAQLAVPKLFVHGEADETVPLELGKQLFEAASEPKDFYLVPRAGHNDLHRHGGKRYLRRLSRFRNRCLRIAAETATAQAPASSSS